MTKKLNEKQIFVIKNRQNMFVHNIYFYAQHLFYTFQKAEEEEHKY